MRAVPFRAIEALESQIVALAERIEARRMSGVDPSLLTPIEDGLSEVRAVLQQLKPQESLAAFQGALQDLTERLSRGRGSHHVSPKPQIDAVIASLDNVAALVSSTETLTALSDEVRGLTARCERIVAPSARPATQKPAQPAADTLPLSIERTLKDINLRLDALQKGSPPRDALAADAGLFSADGSAQDALEAAHATLSELVGRLETNLRAPARSAGCILATRIRDRTSEPARWNSSISDGFPRRRARTRFRLSEDRPLSPAALRGVHR